MSRYRPFVTIVLLAVFVFCAMMPPATFAQTSTPEATPAEVDAGPKFVIMPKDGSDGDYFTIEAEAGTTTTVTAVLGNADDEPLRLRTFASDAITLINGGFGVKEEDQPQTGATTWLTWEPETYDLEPGAGVERDLVVTIPEGTEPGQYIAGVSLQTAEPLEVEGSTMFDQIIRKSVAVFIIVPGPESPSFELGEPEVLSTSAGSRLEVPITNTGNVLVKPAGTVELKDDSGAVVYSAEITMGSVYAGMDTILMVPLDASLAGADYELTVTLEDPDTKAKAGIDAEPLAFTAETAAEAPVQLTTVSVEPKPDATAPQFAAVDVTIENTGDPIASANVNLHVFKDGEEVEVYPVGTRVSIGQGETVLSQRYIPAEGFTSGTWTFEVSVESVNTDGSATTVLVQESVDTSIEVEGN